MPCGEKCACLGTDVECLSVADPARFGHLKSWCESGDPIKRRHVLNRSRIAVGQPAPPPTVPLVAVSSPSPMLAGDLVASLASAVGADRAAKWVAEKLTGVPNCGCPERQAKLNELDRKARHLLARLARRPKP